MKALKKTLMVIAMLAFGAVAAYGACPDNILVVSGDNVYSCRRTGTTSNGSCVYGNCEYIGKRVPAEEVYMN